MHPEITGTPSCSRQSTMIPKEISPPREKEALLSSRKIEGLIANGKYIFILDNKVIKADAWLNYHPGGLKAIQHMIGKDATDEVTAFVILSSIDERFADGGKFKVTFSRDPVANDSVSDRYN
jgi:hypothetical protein